MRKLLLVGGLLLVGVGVVAYLYNKPHSNMNKTMADIQVDATNLFTTFETDENAANDEYLGKVLAVTGTIREVTVNEEGTRSIILDTDSDMSGVVCEMDALSEHAKTDFEPGETITVKGICTGMLMDVVLVRCVIE